MSLWGWISSVVAGWKSKSPIVRISVPVPSGYHKWNVSKNGINPAGIVIHHSWSEDGSNGDWDAITRYHTSYRYRGNIITRGEYETHKKNGETSGLEKPWKDNAYHLGIEKVAGKLKVQTGRPIRSRGAHTIGSDAKGRSFNAFYIGICVVGNFDKYPPINDCLFLLRSMCRDLKALFHFDTDHVIGHRETFTIRGVPIEKSCPGNQFNLEKFRENLNKGALK